MSKSFHMGGLPDIMMTRIEKPLIFITGAPRSGTSLLTKVIDSHPDIDILMENIFGNRRRHWKRAIYWHSPELLLEEVEKTYAPLKAPIVGNKVITPDVWDAGDILQFCRLFESFRIIFMARDPRMVALSRLRREPADFFAVYSPEARDNLLLDFSSRFHAYISSWRQSIENYWKFRDGLKEKVKLVYYDDFCLDFPDQVRGIFSFLEIPFSDSVLRWHEQPHHNAEGELVNDLKYPDTEVFSPPKPEAYPDELMEALGTIEWQYRLWEKRGL